MLSNSCEISPMTAALAEPSVGGDSLTALLGRELTFPAGLLGFPDCQRFSLERFDAGADDPSPFLLLNCRDRELSFVTIPAELALRDYSLPVSADLMERLASAGGQILALLIVTPRAPVEEITVNLQGPLAIGADSAIGEQLVLEGYPLRHPLIVK